MEPRHIDRFFTILDQHLKQRVRVILTGAAAGSLLGHVRASQDIDFAIQPVRGNRWERIEQAIVSTSRLTNIQVNYTTDIDRWSSITFLDYRRHTTPYRRFGQIDVHVLDPVYWSIGKLARGLDADLRDLVAVLSEHRPPPSVTIGVWARALRHSAPSPALTTFRHRVEDFLRTQGRTIWGAQFDPAAAIDQFHRRIRRTPARSVPPRSS
jgi:hypothetical protein